MQKVPSSLLENAGTAGKAVLAAETAAAAKAALSLATVATSGAYSDLTGKPTNPSAFGAVYEFLEHFLSSASLAGNMTAGVTGGTNTSATITGNQFGILQMSTGAAVATGQNARVTATANQLTFGAGELFFATRIAQVSTSWFDGSTLTGALRAGIFTSANADGNGVFFRAKTTAVEIVIRIAGVETAQTIGTLTLNQFVTLAFKVSADGTTVQAWIDGNLAATISTAVGGIKAFHQIHINRDNAVATNVIAQVDFLGLRYTPTAAFFTP